MLLDARLEFGWKGPQRPDFGTIVHELVPEFEKAPHSVIPLEGSHVFTGSLPNDGLDDLVRARKRFLPFLDLTCEGCLTARKGQVLPNSCLNRRSRSDNARRPADPTARPEK